VSVNVLNLEWIGPLVIGFVLLYVVLAKLAPASVKVSRSWHVRIVAGLLAVAAARGFYASWIYNEVPLVVISAAMTFAAVGVLWNQWWARFAVFILSAFFIGDWLWCMSKVIEAPSWWFRDTGWFVEFCWYLSPVIALYCAYVAAVHFKNKAMAR
jgi:hypothetical protein